MKQLVLSSRTGKYETVDVPAPQPTRGQVLVRVRASVVSPGTEKLTVSFAEKNLAQKAMSRPDLVKQVWQKVQRDGVLNAVDTVRTRLGQPMGMGYSCSGEVVALGDGVSGYSVGDTVGCAGFGHASHAELVTVPEMLCANLTALCSQPSDGLIETSAFAALGGIALHAVRLAELSLGETAAVIGLGLLGQIAVQLLKAAGCRVVGMDIDSTRADLASAMGADAVASSPSQMRELIMFQSAGRGADAVLITAATESNEPLLLAAEIARDRAIIVPVGAVGLDVPRKTFYEKELDLRISRSYGPGRYDYSYEEEGHDYPIGYVRWTENRNMISFLQLAVEGKIDIQPLVTHRFPIAGAQGAYDLLLGKSKEPFLAILLTYPTSSTEEARVFHFPGPRMSLSQPDAGATVGLIGAGLFATSTLLPALKRISGVRLVGVATRSGLSARHAGERYGFSYCTTETDRLLDDPAINSIFIVTRHNLHAQQVIRALESGKHVFVEKPLALTVEELQAVADCVERNPNHVLLVGFNRRFAPLAMSMKEFMTKTQEPLVINYRICAGYIPPSHWVHDAAVGGGRIVGEACHFIDFANWLIGQNATDVSASCLPDNGRYVADNAVIELRYPNGSIATITYLANGDRAIGKERVEAHGGGRSAILEDFRSLELATDGRKERRRHWIRHDKGHAGECAAFVEAIRSGIAPIAITDLFASSAAALAAVDCIRTGRSVEINSIYRTSGAVRLSASTTILL